jgi:hypothetical protein
MWVFSNAITATSSNALWNTADTHVVMTGMHLGKGSVSALVLTGTATVLNASGVTAIGTTGLLTDASTGVSYLGAGSQTRIRSIIPPTGGVMQFKGLANGTTIE